MEALRNLDLFVLLAALPVFLLVDAPMSAWVVIVVVWIAGRIGMELAARKRRSALAASNRNAALGVTAAATMGRVWLLAGAILLVGLLDERAAGLAAALLAAALMTVSLASTFLIHLLDPDADRTLR
jgi:hypothetical protein